MRESALPRLLIVDDEPMNIDILNEVLGEYRRSVALNGEDAIKAALRAKPDLILLDVEMPGLSGFEVCRRLKGIAETREIPVIFITAQNDVDYEKTGFEVGAVDYIGKPFSPPIVRARVETHLSLKQTREALRLQNQSLEALVSSRTAQLQQALGEIKDAVLETILRLSRAAEYRDDDTGAHILRMSHYCATIARRLGLPELQVERLLHASPMHDVGKIGIRDNVLRKPGPLTPDEWAIMKSHPEIGARILSGSRSEVVQLAEVIALTHHERWDGTGYPRGLSGAEIPLPGRIAALADVFDALVSRRPYKEPFPLETSLELIREQRGRHFDPKVVDAFFAVLDEILEIRERYQVGSTEMPSGVFGAKDDSPD